MKWADKYRTLKVRTNADTPHDAEVARDFGAEGIGLTRTEHMFFDPRAHPSHARDDPGRRRSKRARTALTKLLPYQQEDFIGIFKAMKGLPVTIRLLDPPLHEFLPHNEKDQAELAQSLGMSLGAGEAARGAASRIQPDARPSRRPSGDHLSGNSGDAGAGDHRSRLRMKKQRINVLPEIMIPLAGTKAELDYLKKYTVETADAVMDEKKTKVEYMYGTMIEVPRAAVTADEMAETAEFFSFGTNDLTQMTFGYSRDDAGSFLPEYVKKEILERDPFQSLDIGGVGKLIAMAVQTRPRNPQGPQVRHLRRTRRRPRASSSATASAWTT